MSRNIVAILVKNHFGVLNRISGMFRRKGFNIDTLTVGETDNHDLSRITISFLGDDDKDQIIKQLEKMPDVVEVAELEAGSFVARELVLLKVKNSPENRQEILSVVDVFRAKVVDYAPETMTIEVTGPTTKIDAFIEFLREYGIIEMCRTGIVALTRSHGHVLGANDKKC